MFLSERLNDLQVKRSKCVATSNLTRDEKVCLVEISCTSSGGRSPIGKRINGDLGGLIDTDCIKIESSDSQAREHFQLRHDARIPLPETILDGSKFGQLTLPIRMDTESLHVSILIKVGFQTTIGNDINDRPVLVPELWEYAGGITFVADLLKTTCLA